MTHRWTKWLCVAALTSFAFGCVAQDQVDHLQTLLRLSKEQNQELQAELEAERAARAALLEQSRGGDAAALEQLERANARIAELEAALGRAEESLRMAGRGQIDVQVDAALAELAAANPGLMTYDPDRGMIRFRSDLTFDSGSDVVKPAAKPGLAELAKIVNQPRAQQYDLRIVGHTDNVPVVKSRAQHPTNWHLSVHRAISVRNEMDRAGVASNRFVVAGYGPYRPVVANGPKGAEANRRVEIYLIPAGERAAVQEQPAPAAPSAPAAPAAPAGDDDDDAAPAGDDWLDFNK